MERLTNFSIIVHLLVWRGNFSYRFTTTDSQENVSQTHSLNEHVIHAQTLSLVSRLTTFRFDLSNGEH